MSGNTFPPQDFGDNDQDSGGFGRESYNSGNDNRSWNNREQGGGYQNRQGGGGGGSYQGGGGGGYQGGNRNYGGGQGGGQGGYQKKPWQGGGGGGFRRQEETDMTLYKPYAFAANEEMAPEMRAKITEVVKMLESKGYTLRVRGMEGIEDEVEKAVTKKEVHLPWREFANKQSRFTFNTERAFAVAKKYHPTFEGLPKGVKAFLAASARTVLGNNMVSPALFLLTWTEDGATSGRERTARTGFAGHPIAIASGIGIPVINLARSDAEQKLQMLITDES